jgi:hypothetical protein
MARKDLLTRLADAGEEALTKLADSQGAERVVGGFNSMKDRVDELQKKVRGIDALEHRVGELERRLAAVEARGRRSSGSTSGARPKAKPTTSGASGAQATSRRRRTPKPQASADASPSSSGASGADDASTANTGGSSPG